MVWARWLPLLLVGDSENLKEVDPERLALAVFIGRISPGAAEGEGAGFDFVPGDGHGAINFFVSLWCWRP
jgi:hypothetical protein